MTMSISRAPAATDASLSAMRSGSGLSPARNPAAVERAHRGLDEPVIDADRRDLEMQIPHAELVLEILPDGAARLAAEPRHPPGRVVALERGEVHQRDGPEQPARLPRALD